MKINMGEKQIAKIVAHVRSHADCPNCHGQFETINFLGYMGDMAFFHMKCGRCQLPMFCSVAIPDEMGQGGVATMEKLPTSNYQGETGSTEPKSNIVRHTPIGYNDVLDFHQYLARTDININFQGEDNG